MVTWFELVDGNRQIGGIICRWFGCRWWKEDYWGGWEERWTSPPVWLYTCRICGREVFRLADEE